MRWPWSKKQEPEVPGKRLHELTAEDAVNVILDLYSFGPMPWDPEPHEFAEQWVMGEPPTARLGLLELARRPGLYEQDDDIEHAFDILIYAWAQKRPEEALNEWAPLLQETYARESALAVMCYVAQDCPALRAHVETILKDGFAALADLNGNEEAWLCGMLNYVSPEFACETMIQLGLKCAFHGPPENGSPRS